MVPSRGRPITPESENTSLAKKLKAEEGEKANTAWRRWRGAQHQATPQLWRCLALCTISCFLISMVMEFQPL